MPLANPLLHRTIPGTGSGYVTEEAEASAGGAARSAEIMPMQLALMLLAAGAGLWALNALGFRFVFEASKLGK
jgi:hypothetical protein